MITGRRLLILLAFASIVSIASTGCDYIVPPIDFGTPTPGLDDQGWSGIATKVGDAAGGLRVDLSIVNNTNSWSAMDIGRSKAKITDSSGKSSDCDTVYVGTSVFVNDGGWYLPPGFAMKAYTGGSASAPTVQPLYVECSGVTSAAGAKLSITYTYITGHWNYYVPSQRTTKTFQLNLDKVSADVAYPVAQKVATLEIVKSDQSIVGINNCTVQLTAVKRTATGFEFDWSSSNPTDYPAYIHIGQPPVIGSDGVLYGYYESPHLADAPITPAQGKATWNTEIAVPSNVTGLYILLPLETQQAKYFVDHVIDITDR